MIKILFVAPDGLASPRWVMAGEITATDETRVIRGWGRLSGPAVVCTGPAAGDYLYPIATAECDETSHYRGS